MQDTVSVLLDMIADRLPTDRPFPSSTFFLMIKGQCFKHQGEKSYNITLSEAGCHKEMTLHAIFRNVTASADEPKEELVEITPLCIKCHFGRDVFVNVNVLNTSVRDLAAMVTAEMKTVDTFESHIDHFSSLRPNVSIPTSWRARTPSRRSVSYRSAVLVRPWEPISLRTAVLQKLLPMSIKKMQLSSRR